MDKNMDFHEPTYIDTMASIDARLWVRQNIEQLHADVRSNVPHARELIAALASYDISGGNHAALINAMQQLHTHLYLYLKDKGNTR